MTDDKTTTIAGIELDFRRLTGWDWAIIIVIAPVTPLAVAYLLYRAEVPEEADNE